MEAKISVYGFYRIPFVGALWEKLEWVIFEMHMTRLNTARGTETLIENLSLGAVPTQYLLDLGREMNGADGLGALEILILEGTKSFLFRAFAQH